MTPEYLCLRGRVGETVVDKLEATYDQVGGFGHLLILGCDYSDNPGVEGVHAAARRGGHAQAQRAAGEETGDRDRLVVGAHDQGAPMEALHITVRYSDGTQKTMPVGPDQSILEAAEEHGVAIVNECQSGICGTCVATCASGDYDMGRTEGLSEVERDAQDPDVPDVRQVRLPDRTSVSGRRQCRALDHQTRGGGRGGSGVIDHRDSAGGCFGHGRHPRLQGWAVRSVAGSRHRRVAQLLLRAPADGRDELEFIVRLLPHGVMSNYLRDSAIPVTASGCGAARAASTCAPLCGPVVLVAGGTGLSAILAMAQSLEDVAQPVHLLYGVTNVEDLCKLDELKALAGRVPNLQVHVIVARPDEQWDGPVGLVTVCSPTTCWAAAMPMSICAARPRWWKPPETGWKIEVFIASGLYYEKFVPSGAVRRRTPPRLDYAKLDLADVRHRGRRDRGGHRRQHRGIAGKVCSDTFDGSSSSRRTTRTVAAKASAAQGVPASAHLLTAGRIELERIFPGIIDDMVREGAFDVDMAASTASVWAEPGRSRERATSRSSVPGGHCSNGVRRRLDDEPRISFHYRIGGRRSRLRP